MKYFHAVLIVLTVFTCTARAQVPDHHDLPKVNIGWVVDGPWEGNERIKLLFRKEMAALLGSEFRIDTLPDMPRDGAWEIDVIHSQLQELLDDDRIDIVVAAGYLASAESIRLGREGFPKPLIAPFVINSEAQSFPLDGVSSGVHNFTYLTFRKDLTRDLQAFRELVPFDQITVLLPRQLRQRIELLSRALGAILSSTGLEHRFVFVDRTAESALSQLNATDEAVALGPLMNMAPGELDKLLYGFIERELPSMSIIGRDEVERGALMTIAPAVDFERVARRVALTIQRILLGADPAGLSVEFVKGEALTINMATARAIGVKPDWIVMSEAKVLHEDEPAGRPLTLAGLIDDVLAANLDLIAAGRAVDAGAREVDLARSRLLPQLEISSTGLLIDSDRAEASFGQQPEKTVTGNASLSQVIFAEPLLANYSIQRSLQRARENQRRTAELDLVEQAITSYLNVLRTEAFLRIQRDNLALSRSNLDLAQTRRRIGVAGPAEVYRWESQIANNRKAVIEAEWGVHQAMAQVNRLMNRPQEELFSTEEQHISDAHYATSDPRIGLFNNNKWNFAIFRDFLVSEGLANSPEIRQLDNSIAAQKRALRSSGAAFWAPKVGLEASLSNRMYEGGSGTEGLSIELPGAPLDLPRKDDTDWHVGLSVSLPLFTGGSRRAERGKASVELDRLHVERNALSDKIEQRIRDAAYRTAVSFPSIRLTHDASRAAQQNLELVIDSYSQGLVSIIDLLDAQNAALVSQQLAENSVYDFLIDMIAVHRATGSFWIMQSETEREAWLGRLEAFSAERGGPVFDDLER